jgi:hypothetical protein
MASPARRLESNDREVERAWREAPDTQVAEILDGELVVSPRPARAQAWSTSAMGARLSPPFMFGDGGPGGWVILVEPELWLGPNPDKPVPDVAGWRRDRLPVDAFKASAPAYFDLAPD